MASYKEDERFKKDEFAQANEVPILDIGTQAVIGIERDYQKKDILESTDLGDHSADLGALPAFLTGASVSYYQLNWQFNEDKDPSE